MNQPSQGLISLSRVTGSADCFGCDIPLDGYISLKVTTAKVQRGVGKEYYISGTNVVQLRLTNFQFSELITNLNSAGNIPCTLEVIDGKPVDRYQKNETIVDNYKASIVDLSSECFEILQKIEMDIQELSEAKTPSKRKIKQVKSNIDSLHTKLKEDIPWLQGRFQEDMMVVVAQMKEEASAWIQHKLMKLGLDKVKKLK